MDLAEAFKVLQAGLKPLGIELGPDVLALWRDRDQHGAPPLSAANLVTLFEAIGLIASHYAPNSFADN